MELRLRFFFLSIRFFVRFWFYLFLFLFVFFVRFWMTEPNAHLAPNRLRSLCSCRIRRARRRSPLQNASAEIGGRSSATPGFCHCSDTICDSCNAFNLVNALTLPWPTEALAKDATLFTVAKPALPHPAQRQLAYRWSWLPHGSCPPQSALFFPALPEHSSCERPHRSGAFD